MNSSKNCNSLIAVTLSIFFTIADSGQAAMPQALELDNEVVCRVNTDVISKRDIEYKMLGKGREVVYKIFAMREKQKAEGSWNAQTQSDFDKLYWPLFRDELKEAVKERLQHQQALEEKIELDEAKVEKAVLIQAENFRQNGMLGKPGYKFHDIRKAVRENMLIRKFQESLVTALDLPSKQEISSFYDKNMARYQRKTGYKVRIIRINRIETDEVGKLKVKEDARDRAEQLRKEIVEYGADFGEVAKEHSDGDKSEKDRRGLLLGKNGDEFLVAEDQSDKIASYIGKTPVGKVSVVFDLNDRTLAMIYVEASRPAGPRPLDIELYNQINQALTETVMRTKEESWFRKSLAKSLILDSREKPLPITFFIPDEDKKTPDSDAAEKEGKGINIRTQDE